MFLCVFVFLCLGVFVFLCFRIFDQHARTKTRKHKNTKTPHTQKHQRKALFQRDAEKGFRYYLLLRTFVYSSKDHNAVSFPEGNGQQQQQSM